MKCVIPNHNVKVLAKAFHSLGRIGDDLFIEPQNDHLAFRTVNMAESAYASFSFSKSFFSSFNFTEDDDEEALRCKIAMKSLLVVFKSQHGERMVEWCQIRLDPNGTKVVFQLRYSYGCTKTHFLPILESETLQANYSKEDCQNRLSASPKLLMTAVKNFRANEPEVTLCVMPQKVLLRNHVENNIESKKALKTEIGMYPTEFEGYNIGAPTSVTFCLKELRAVLFFAEYTGLSIHFYFSTAGRPVVFVVKNDTVYEANYVVSTLSESGTSQSLSQSSESSVATNSRANIAVNTRKRPHQETEEMEQYGDPNSQTKRFDRSVHSPTPLAVANSMCHAGVSGVDLMNHSAASSSVPMDVTTDSNVTQPIIRSVFGRCFNTTFKKQSLPGFNKVLAYDSDGMEDSD